MRNIIKGNEKYNEAFLNSLDNTNTWSEINITIENATDVYALTNTKLWEDGAPVLKYFERNQKKAAITLQGNYNVIVDYDDYECYLFSENVWYQFDLSSIDYIEN